MKFSRIAWIEVDGSIAAAELIPFSELIGAARFRAFSCSSSASGPCGSYASITCGSTVSLDENSDESSDEGAASSRRRDSRRDQSTPGLTCLAAGCGAGSVNFTRPKCSLLTLPPQSRCDRTRISIHINNQRPVRNEFGRSPQTVYLF
jgi:hypothetical protein